MGTSKSNPGLRRTPLLPPWAPQAPDSSQDADNNPPDEADKNDQGDQDSSSTPPPQEKPMGDWANAKSRITSFTKTSSRTERGRILRGAAKSYVSGSGGSRRISSSAVHGKSVGVRLGGALAGIANEGAKRTFERLGLGDLDNLTVESAFNKLAQHLCANGSTTEESVANVAVVIALAQLYETFDLDNNDLENLDNLTSDQVNEIIECYVSTYVYERWLHELGMSIEEKDISTSNVIAFEEEIKEFVVSSISLEFSGKDLTTLDFNQGEGKEIIDSVFQQAYELIEQL